MPEREKPLPISFDKNKIDLGVRLENGELVLHGTTYTGKEPPRVKLIDLTWVGVKNDVLLSFNIRR